MGHHTDRMKRCRHLSLGVAMVSESLTLRLFQGVSPPFHVGSKRAAWLLIFSRLQGPLPPIKNRKTKPTKSLESINSCKKSQKAKPNPGGLATRKPFRPMIRAKVDAAKRSESQSGSYRAQLFPKPSKSSSKVGPRPPSARLLHRNSRHQNFIPGPIKQSNVLQSMSYINYNKFT